MDNTIANNASYATLTGGGANRIHSDAHAATVGGGVYNTIKTAGWSLDHVILSGTMLIVLIRWFVQ